jgi:hypothetical protein
MIAKGRRSFQKMVDRVGVNRTLEAGTGSLSPSCQGILKTSLPLGGSGVLEVSFSGGPGGGGVGGVLVVVVLVGSLLNWDN